MATNLPGSNGKKALIPRSCAKPGPPFTWNFGLEAFVGHLPAVESLREGEADGLGAVVSEIRKDAQQGV